MIYYTFNSKEQAEQAEQIIVTNIKNWLLQNIPEALTSDLTGLKGKNAKTREWDESVITTRWAIPQERLDGKWVFLKPTEEKIFPIPVPVAIENVNAEEEEEYNSNWFSNDLQ